MQNLPSRLTVLLLAFAVGTACATVFLFQAQAAPTVSFRATEIPVEQNQPATPPAAAKKTLEMVFVLDTTGSMGGLLEGAKQKIWSIVNDVMQRQDRPNVRVGLVAYRDNNDAYVTQITPLTDDLDKVYSTLMDFRAEGGGDTPENVRRALAEGVEKAGWTRANSNTAQIIFLVGDAPPQNYVQEPDVLTTTAKAVSRNMIVNTIQCGNAGDTRQIWQQIAQRGGGKFFAISQDGGVQAINTPYDARLAELAARLGSTYLAYGNESERRINAARQSATELKVTAAAPTVAQADRAMNKAINRDAYKGDLLQSIENDSVKLEAVKEDELPDDLKKLSPAERRREIDRRLAERRKIRAEILELSKQRDSFIQEAKRKTGRQDGFDAAVSNALREQMTRKGIK